MTWVPSNNTPGDKARYTFRVNVPSALKVAANGVLASRSRHAGPDHVDVAGDGPDVGVPRDRVDREVPVLPLLDDLDHRSPDPDLDVRGPHRSAARQRRDASYRR